MIYTYENLPTADNLNPYSYCLAVEGEIFIQKGKMVAYYGSLRFESLGANMLELLVQESFNAPLYANDFIVVMGRGKLVLGDNGNHIASYDLENGNLTVKKDHLLGFTRGLICEQSLVPDYLTLLGTGRFLASSNGPVHFMEPPVYVDEEALLGWADLPCPSYHYDYEYIKSAIAMIGGLAGVGGSGEEKQMNFTGQGTVLVQSSESGLKGRSDVQAWMAQISGMHQNDLQQLSSAIALRLRELMP